MHEEDAENFKSSKDPNRSPLQGLDGIRNTFLNALECRRAFEQKNHRAYDVALQQRASRSRTSWQHRSTCIMHQHLPRAAPLVFSDCTLSAFFEHKLSPPCKASYARQEVQFCRVLLHFFMHTSRN